MTSAFRDARLAVGLVVVCLLGAALASPAHAENAASAREHYERGTKFYDIGKYDDAIREFEAAYEAKSDPAFIYNLAQAHRLAGHNQEALQLYRNYLRYVPNPPNRADIDERIRGLEKAIAERSASGTATPPSTAPSQQPGSASTSPGAPAGPPPAAPPPPAPAPGSYGAPETYGGPGSTTEGQPPLGQPTDVNGQPIPQPPNGLEYGNANQPPVSAPAPRSSRRKAGIIIAAIGGGFLLGGAISGLVTWSETKQLEKAAQNHDTFDPSVESSGRTAAVLQWVGYGVGAAAVGLGVILIATAPSNHEADGQRVAALPLVGPGLGGAQLRMSF